MQTPQKKPYLVTGAAGFIGSRFIESCNAKNVPVISVDQLDLFQTRPEHQSFNFGALIDRDQLVTELTTHAHHSPPMSAIVHLGAITDTRESNLELLNRYNLNYTQILWNYATTHQIPFIYASSAATYGGGEFGYQDEESLMSQLKPLNPYGASKLTFDLWALNQEKQRKTPPHWAGFKFFNVYGFGENHKGFMASVVLHAFHEIQKTGSVTLFKSHRPEIADGHQKRDFIAVEDVVQVLHFALEKPIQRGIYNLGTGVARTFLDLTRATFAALNKSEKIHYINTPESIRDKYQYYTQATMERLRDQGWETPFTSLEAGVQQTIRRLCGQR